MNVRREDAAGYVFGYTVFNDLSARTMQKAHQQWFRGKSLDGFAPMGPWIVTADEIPFPPALDLTSRVNGQTRQRGNTRDMIFGVGEILAELSRGMTLEAGTILATGPPPGWPWGWTAPASCRPAMWWSARSSASVFSEILYGNGPRPAAF